MAISSARLSLVQSQAAGAEKPSFEVYYCDVSLGRWFPKYGSQYGYRANDGMRLFRRYGRTGQSKFDYDLIFAEFANDERGEATVHADDIEDRTLWFIAQKVISLPTD